MKDLKKLMNKLAHRYAWSKHPRTDSHLKGGVNYAVCVNDYIAGYEMAERVYKRKLERLNK